MLSEALRRFAETPDRFTDIGPDVARYADDEVCVLQGPTWASISGVRTDDVEGVVAKVRALVPAEKHPVWWIGPSAEPADLFERLRGLGFGDPEDHATVLHAVACASEPPQGPDDVVVRRVETFDEFVVAMEVMWEGFETREERRERDRPHLRTMYGGMRESGVPATFVALLDGEPVGIGRSVYAPLGSFLIAGAVVPRARGRGVYRALVRARWDDAAARGTPALITEAVPHTSFPILTRLGFVEVCTIRRLGDPGP